MIVVDTNVISELMRPEPNPKVLAWIAAQPRAQLYTTHINQIEILYGIAVLPEGRRRDALKAAADGMFAEDFLPAASCRSGLPPPRGMPKSCCRGGGSASRSRASTP